jgi:DNA replication and repair protein RecF
MFLKHLILRHFRNYVKAEVSFAPGINWIQGDNGQGKTNLLEAIHLLSTGRSFRGSALSDLICFQNPYLYVEGHFEKEGVQQEIKIYYDETTRKVQHNQMVYPNLTSVLGILPSIILSPEDLSLITGAPSERRRFLDMYIAQTDPLYVHHLGRYFKAMRQRNVLLKNRSESAIEAWEATMAESAEYLLRRREEAVSGLRAPLQAWMQKLSAEKDKVTVQYMASNPNKQRELLMQTWRKSRSKEMCIGSTLSGPHRDDVMICLGERSVKFFSSEGQKRSCIASLRFAQWEEMQTLAGHPPILGIDDFGIQLDPHRQRQLTTHLKSFSQIFLTSPLPCSCDGARFQVEAGVITECA